MTMLIISIVLEAAVAVIAALAAAESPLALV
jgi:hypothetical protein